MVHGLRVWQDTVADEGKTPQRMTAEEAEEAIFSDIITVTTVDEQRATPWMEFESLSDFLGPNDPTKTVEGHPAPKRAVIIANKAFNESD